MSARRKEIAEASLALGDEIGRRAIKLRLGDVPLDDRKRFIFGVLGSVMAVCDVFGVTFEHVRGFLDDLERHRHTDGASVLREAEALRDTVVGRRS